MSLNSRLFSGVSILLLIAIAVGRAATAGQLTDTFTNWVAHPAIEYGTRPTRDPIARLNREIDAGRRQLKAEGPSGYLKSLLGALNVPIESQVVVFVKDSVQARRIDRTNPRAIFFNDSVAVGWVRGGFIELASQDPEQGVIFYTLDSTWTGKPQFTRQDHTCLSCHYSYSTSGVPGMLMRSSGQFESNHRVPFAQRWGGWYVTGQHGTIRHMGNADIDKLYENPRPADTFNWASLDGRFDTNGYLSPHSDIAALAVFEHQMHMMNLLSRIGWEARVGEYQRRGAKLLPGVPVGEKPPVPLTEAAGEVVDYMLFIDEAPLADTIKGSTDFAEKFAARGPLDRKGRSLRQLDLERRLMRYPCSYMIYTELFDALPAAAKEALYQRLWQILSGQEKSPRYTRLPAVDRQAIIEILYDTKNDLPAYFQPGARVAN